MYTFLVFITVIIAAVLVIMILMQSSKGGGLAGTFGGAGNIGTMFGSRRTADFLSKGTWWLAGALVVLTIIINLFFLPGQANLDNRESIIQKSANVPTQPTVPQQRPQQPGR
ncbi:MAG TPA: preprotein translocase subunit SecG [Ignavibacteriales bacterium]|nr:preprotein translocase subunit SecG [Ignavibacteriales bacterium]